MLIYRVIHKIISTPYCNKNGIIAVLMLMVLSGCSIAKGSSHYTEGTKYLQSGDYESARYHLEKACEYVPNYSPHQNNLACAYIGLGDIDKAWYHSRQAVTLDPTSDEAVITFNRLYEEIATITMIREDSTLDDVRAAFGDPDQERKYEKDGVYKCRYGLCIMRFKDNLLKECVICEFKKQSSQFSGKKTILNVYGDDQKEALGSLPHLVIF